MTISYDANKTVLTDANGTELTISPGEHGNLLISHERGKGLYFHMTPELLAELMSELGRKQ